MPVPVIGEGNPKDRYSIPLATKRGTSIPNVRKNERSPQLMREAREIHARRFPGIRVRSLSSTYNCVGLVFASRRTWVDPSEVPELLRDDEYRRVENPEVGDIAVYRCGQEVLHIAVVVRIGLDRPSGPRNMELLSQWGADGEYFHSETDLPMEVLALESGETA